MSEGERQFSEEDVREIQDSEAVNKVTHDRCLKISACEEGKNEPK